MSEGFWSNSERSEAHSASLRKVYNLVAREARWPRVVLAACELGWPIYIYFLNIYIGHFQLVSASSVTSRSICFSGSCCIHVQDLIFIYRLWKKFLDYRWITSKFLQYQWPTRASTTILDSRSGCKSSPGRTLPEQQ